MKRELWWPVPFTLQAVALHAAATNHWSRGVRERAYTVASRLTLVCGIPVGPNEEDEEAENSGEAANPSVRRSVGVLCVRSAFYSVVCPMVSCVGMYMWLA
jgi:hypothetical protein